MELRVLAVGDVVGEGGLQCLEQHLRSLKKLYRIDFCVVNGENASGTGLTPKQADRMLDAGADILTLGKSFVRPARDLRVSGRLPLYPAARQSASEPAGTGLRRV